MTKKNNKALRAALVLCVLALFCAAFVGATFAKYVTADDASDTARAAKWGIAVSIGGKLFGQHYVKNVGVTETDDIVAINSTNVASNNEANIVAPGTKSDKGIIIDLKGTPEVEYKVDATSANNEDIYLGKGTWGVMVPAQVVTQDNFDKYFADEANSTDKLYKKDGDKYVVANAWEADTPYYELHDQVTIADDQYTDAEGRYYPILWTVANAGEDTTTLAGGRDLAVVAESIRAALDAIETPADQALANENLEAKYTLTWAWAFDTQNDGADTILGNLMQEDAAVADVVILDGADYIQPVADTNYNLEVAFNIGVTVTQVN